MLQDTESIPADIVVSLSEKKIGFRLDNADLVKINTVFNYFVFNFFIHLKNKTTTFHFSFFLLLQVFVPLRKYNYWYIVVANFRDGRFEVICPFKDIAIIQSDAFNVICKFRKVFKAVHSRSTRVDIYDMPTVFGSVSNQTNQLSNSPPQVYFFCKTFFDLL